MKKHLISLTAMVMAIVMMLGLSCPSLAEDADVIGMLSYLNMSEEDHTAALKTFDSKLYGVLGLNGILESKPVGSDPVYKYYDSLDAMLLALQAGEVSCIHVPYYTALYLLSNNAGLKLKIEFHPEKAEGMSLIALKTLSDGYSFMMREEDMALRAELNTHLMAMKEDGTMEKLIDEHIIKVANGAEPTAISFDKFEGDPIRVAVTGSLPPLDYVAADGTFAGFNTAVLAELGRRMQKNIELVQVDSIGRALALAEGTVDVVFWTRARTSSDMDLRNTDFEGSVSRLSTIGMTEEERAIMRRTDGSRLDEEKMEGLNTKDIPDGTIITDPYFEDFGVLVDLK